MLVLGWEAVNDTEKGLLDLPSLLIILIKFEVNKVLQPLPRLCHCKELDSLPNRLEAQLPFRCVEGKGDHLSCLAAGRAT
jgi:hypothetical protein